jgi:hypothetical protein
LTTAWFINIISLWHALITSRKKACSVTAANLEENVEFLRGFAHIVHHTTFGCKNYWKPLNSGLILSTLSYINLCENLISEGYAFVLGARITQDALENIFSQIRRKAGRKPSAIQCLRAIRLISISQFFSEIKSKKKIKDPGVPFHGSKSSFRRLLKLMGFG